MTTSVNVRMLDTKGEQGPAEVLRCDVYRLGGSCGLYAQYTVCGPFDWLDACHEHLVRIIDAQIANERLLCRIDPTS